MCSRLVFNSVVLFIIMSFPVVCIYILCPVLCESDFVLCEPTLYANTTVNTFDFCIGHRILHVLC